LAKTDPMAASQFLLFMSNPPNGPDRAREMLADVGITEFEPSENLRDPSRVVE
jgi:hypothetical protein